ncbi:MAG: hypothetical protein JRH13_10680 [Deltaproteobacteria bacterium]|nr:hypothetical protein [Deltaproteobacteria bacterium]MBW2017859.1 hypothetical protein [Deltaproteobacteria bacterium]MBW2129816.1 hypothetical protein [Deltaproteobacteria bacterium]
MKVPEEERRAVDIDVIEIVCRVKGRMFQEMDTIRTEEFRRSAASRVSGQQAGCFCYTWRYDLYFWGWRGPPVGW